MYNQILKLAFAAPKPSAGRNYPPLLYGSPRHRQTPESLAITLYH